MHWLHSNAADFPYRFSTKPQDLITGLYYYGYRWYDPITGRWPSRDPIEERGGVNLFGFVRNNPITNIDIYGKSTLCVGCDSTETTSTSDGCSPAIAHTVPVFAEEGEACDILPGARLVNLKLSIAFPFGNRTGTKNFVRTKLSIDYKITGFYIGPKWSFYTCHRPDSTPGDADNRSDIASCNDNEECVFDSGTNQMIAVKLHYLSCECDTTNGGRIWKKRAAATGGHVDKDKYATNGAWHSSVSGTFTDRPFKNPKRKPPQNF
jgi:RHS repeat-associated protein